MVLVFFQKKILNNKLLFKVKMNTMIPASVLKQRKIEFYTKVVNDFFDDIWNSINDDKNLRNSFLFNFETYFNKLGIKMDDIFFEDDYFDTKFNEVKQKYDNLGYIILHECRYITIKLP